MKFTYRTRSHAHLRGSGDPLHSIHALRTIGFVMKGGVVVRNDWAGNSDR